jgi:hypothetical protein
MTQELETETTVSLPAPLAEVANRIAAQQHWTFPEAVVFLIKRGAKAQQEAEENVENNFNRFMEADANQRQQAGDDLIRAIFGPESLA